MQTGLLFTDSFEVAQYLKMQCSKQLTTYPEIISTIIEYCVRYLDDLSRLEDDLNDRAD